MSKANRISGYFDYGGVLLVPVSLNGDIYTFMVDCGAAHCIINRNLLDQIAAEVSDTKLRLAPIGKQTVLAPALKIKNFEVGARKQNNVTVGILDFPDELKKLNGLLGMNFLGNYRFTMEPDTATLVLRNKPIRKK